MTSLLMEAWTAVRARAGPEAAADRREPRATSGRFVPPAECRNSRARAAVHAQDPKSPLIRFPPKEQHQKSKPKPTPDKEEAPKDADPKLQRNLLTFPGGFVNPQD